MRTLTLLGLLSVLLAAGAGCATPEERIVDYYLAAVRDGQDGIVAGVSLVSFPEEDIQSWEIVEIGGDVLRFLSKKNDVWFPKPKPVPVMGTEKENHTSWERYYRVSDCSSSSRNNWYLGR